MVDQAGADPRRQVADRMAEAARLWLTTLDPQQHAAGSWGAPSDDVTDSERRRWFYTPTDHGGLSMHHQRPAQQRAAMRLVATGLSTPGYVGRRAGLLNALLHGR